MQEKDELLNQLEQILHFKKSKRFYAERLGVTEEEINELYKEFRSKNQIEENNKEKELTNKSKILLLDIETSPIMAYVWQTQVWKARIGHKQLLNNWFMLSWSAKWLGEDEVFSDSLSPIEAVSENDETILTSLWLLLDEANIVIGHNSSVFDIPNIQTRCVFHKLPPPSPYKQIDTLKVAQQQFGFTHNSLDALAKFFGIDGKTETDFQLWKDCIHGDAEALYKMEQYNRNDVIVLEKIYYFLRPYMRNHPNLDLYVDNDSPVCTTCGKNSLAPMPNKYFYTQAVRYPIYRCSSCGAISRAKKGEPYTNKKLISSIPR